MKPRICLAYGRKTHTQGKYTHRDVDVGLSGELRVHRRREQSMIPPRVHLVGDVEDLAVFLWSTRGSRLSPTPKPSGKDQGLRRGGTDACWLDKIRPIWY
jgi:hypothetical protein